MAGKDFAPIESDYAFFMTHATEADADLAEHARQLAGFADERASIRLLDFGCGAGEFTERLLAAMHWPPAALEIALVEPVYSQRNSAARRLASFSIRPIVAAESLPRTPARPFDLILSNHVLYYVDDLEATLRELLAALSPGGKLLTAIAGWDNVLLGLWKSGFALIGQPVPYHSAEDVEAVLSRLKATFRKTTSPYRLRFPDSPENRLKILRFLFAEHLAQLPVDRLLAEFDPYVRAAHVDIHTHSYHFALG